MAPRSRGTPRVAEAVGDAPRAPPRSDTDGMPCAGCRAAISGATAAQLQGRAGKLLARSCISRKELRHLPKDAAAPSVRCSPRAGLEPDVDATAALI